VGAFATPTALAQSDWGVRRDPFDAALVARYKRILEKTPADKRALGKLVRLYKRYRSLGKLVGEYEAAHAKRASFSTAMILGHLYLEQGRSSDALARYEQAANLQPRSAAAQAARGELHRRAGNTDKAAEAYRAALEASKGAKQKKPHLRVLAELALSSGDIDAARAFFDDYIALDPKDLQARVDLADALSQYGRHADAIEVLEKLEPRLKSDPQARVDVIARLGAAYEALAQEDAAIREYRRAMALTKRGYYLRRELTERIVEIHRRRQDLVSLLDFYEKKWPARSRDHFEWDVLARLYEETGNQEKAIAAYRRAVRKAPYELDTQRRLIVLLENSGREDEALGQYEVVIKIAPGEPRFQLELAERYWRRGDESKALTLLSKIERRFAVDPSVHSALADLYARWGKEDLALRAYQRLVKIEPGEIDHLVNLGEQHFQRGQKDRAVTVWKRIAAKKTPEGFAKLAAVYAEHDMLSQSLAMYSRAIKLDGKKAAYYKGRARVYERQKRWLDAVRDWEQVLAHTPDKASERGARREARRRIVTVLTRARDRKLHTRHRSWKAAFESTPPDLEAGYFLVELYLKQSKRDAARAVLERILANDADDRNAMELLVKVYTQGLEYDRAIQLLSRLAELSPSRQREYFNQIAELKTRLYQDEDAILYSQKALAQSPNDPVAHEQLAVTYERMQKYDEAIAAYKRTLELDPRNFRAHFALATLYIRKGSHNDAATLYRAVLRRATDEQTLHRAGRKAIDLEEYIGSLGELEKVVAPLAFTFSHKPTYRQILVELYDRYVPRLVDEARSGDASQAAEARSELARLGAHGLKPLLEALADQADVSQQRIAVDVLGHLANKGAAMPLVKLASAAADPAARRSTSGHPIESEVRVRALVAAGLLRDQRIVGALGPLLSDRDEAKRAAATFALGLTGSERARPLLVDALDDQRDAVQGLACLGLGQVGDPRAAAAVTAAMNDLQRDGDVRAACAFALGLIGAPGSVAPLIEVLKAGNDEVQRMAAWALGRIGDRRALPALLAAYFSKRDRVRDAVAWAVPRVAAGRSDDSLVPGVELFPTKKGGRYVLRQAVRDLLGALDSPELAPGLVVGHEDQLVAGLREALGRHADVVARVLRDLDARPDGLALGPLTAGLDSASASDRQAIEAVLARIGERVAIDLAALARTHRNNEIRALALSILGKLVAADGRDALVAGLADDSPAVRAAAMRAAASFARKNPANAADLAGEVAGALGDRHWQQRAAAARALGRFGQKARTAWLVSALGDRSGFVREAAADALGRLRRKNAVPALLEATRDESVAVQLAAVKSLVTIGDGRARRRLEQIASDRSVAGRVRAAAKRFK